MLLCDLLTREWRGKPALSAMNQSFCQCGREHSWPLGTHALCRCGRVLEPMTKQELTTVRLAHERTLVKIAQANDLEPLIRLFRD